MNGTDKEQRPVVVLCGFMGTGKSSVGEALARHLGVEFIDTDAVIEAREGMTVAEIFDRRGERRFRELEAEVCRSLAPRDGAVIATGGGMVMDPRNLLHLQSLGTTVLLEATVGAILERAGSDGDRPLLAGASGKGDHGARIESLLASRQDTYNQCDLRLDTTVRSPDEAAADIAEMLAVRAGGHTLVPLRVDVRSVPGVATTRLSRVVVGEGVAGGVGPWLDRLGLGPNVIVLAPPHLDAAVARVRGPLPSRIVQIDVDDGDAAKTLEQASRMIDAFAEAGAGRDTVVVTVGGGVTGDLGAFAASIYMRGLPVVQVPTSLLAQVDASIGGKTGVNHPRAKNLIGTVHQPLLVLADPQVLDTLPEEEFANGMAEVVKTAIIGSPVLFAELEETAAGRPDAAFLARMVAECARVKGRVVELDPFERDLRRVLNLGHTLGHALESALDYRLSHGAAVGLGILAAWRVAVARGEAEALWYERTRTLLERFGLPTAVPDADASRVRDALALDKKRRTGRLTFVLPHHPGRVSIRDDVTDDELMAAMSD
jgi:3-dehydroquinate synthase